MLLIGATGVHPTTLRTSDFTVGQAHTLLDGYTRAVQWLDRTSRICPTLILLDIHTREPGFPALTAPHVAAVLTHQMHQGALHPAWIVGLTPDPTGDAAAEAQIAGCQQILRVRMSAELLSALQHLTAAPALLPRMERATRAYQRAAQRLLYQVQIGEGREEAA